jgi:16S rRNA (cytidine1402-2'-O)-methyltransferase
LRCKNMSCLYIIATPIGNLEDMTLRAVRILKEVDLILCEDTRVTKVLLEHYQIKTPLSSYHQHSKGEKVNYITNLLLQGKNLALVSDAGTPGISDPGNLLIKELTVQLKEGFKIIPIPGASAIISALSISGFPTDKFLFLGFAPVKNKRNKFFQEAASSHYPAVFYESPYRIIKTLNELKKINELMEIVVCRELTKKFETIYRGTITQVIEKIPPEEIKGEFTVVIRNKEK